MLRGAVISALALTVLLAPVAAASTAGLARSRGPRPS